MLADYNNQFGFPKWKTMKSFYRPLQTCEGAADCKVGNDSNADHKVVYYYWG